MYAFINEEGGDTELELTLSESKLVTFEIATKHDLEDEIRDENGRSWAPAKPVTIRFKRQNAYIVYPISQIGTFRNAYEATRTVYG